MRNKKAPKSMLDLPLDVEGDTRVKVPLTRTPESTSFRLATAESGHQSLPADLQVVPDTFDPAIELDVIQVAELLGLAPQTVRRYANPRTGELPSSKAKNREGKIKLLIRLGDLRDFAASGGFVIEEAAIRRVLEGTTQPVGRTVTQPEARTVTSIPTSGGEVAPRALAPSSTLRLELIVETP